MKSKTSIYLLMVALVLLVADVYSTYFNFFRHSAIENYQLIPSLIQRTSLPEQASNSRSPIPEQTPTATTSDQIIQTTELPPVNQEKNILLGVPFTSQAPFGNWSDPRQQDGCEEAATLMAVYWAKNLPLNPTIAENEILSIANYERQQYNNYHDTSAPDTVKRIFNGYFNFNRVQVLNITSPDDIIAQLKNGKLVIVPTNGQLLGNPYYTQPGPLEHNLVIKGYDFSAGEFITNDAGTRRGDGYRYKKDTLWQAIRDYPTGDKEPIIEIIKDMIVVSK